MELRSYASDLLEDAMVLAQAKALNSFSFRDTINTLTELWGYCYERMAQIDSGYYSRTIRLTSKLTTLPAHVKNAVRVYSSREQVGFVRRLYVQAGMNDLNGPRSFHISGNDIYCYDADIRQVYCEYVPEPPFVTFTKNNRDPRIVWRPIVGQMPNQDDPPANESVQRNMGMYRLWGDRFDQPKDNTAEAILARINDKAVPLQFEHRATGSKVDCSASVRRDGWSIVSFIIDNPWVFISYMDDITGECESYVSKGMLTHMPADKYNPFDYQGRGSNVQFVSAKYNDYTGMGVVVLDLSDGLYKEMGWTPDTLMVYPSRIMYNYMVATMAQRFAALNGSTIMAVEMAVISAADEMGMWLKKNKSAWGRADNVTGPQLSDFL